jgi:hypothetical protein
VYSRRNKNPGERAVKNTPWQVIHSGKIMKNWRSVQNFGMEKREEFSEDADECTEG